MPVGDYQFLSLDEARGHDWSLYVEDQPYGHVLLVDLDVPEHLHALFDSLPLCPERMTVTEGMLSPIGLSCLQQLKHVDTYKSVKLVTSLLPKTNYLIHEANLALYLQLGLVLTRLHSVIRFRQSTFLRTFIECCTEKRRNSSNEFRKMLFKLFSNSCYGKLIENSREYMDAHFVTDKKQMTRWVSKPRFISFRVLSDDVVVIFMKPKAVRLMQAWACGFTILERSKGLVYDQYYNEIIPSLGVDVVTRICMTDTDSLLISITSKMTRMEIMRKLKHIMDFSNYDASHPLYDDSRRNALKYWKDETEGKDIAAFCGLASKSYCIKLADDSFSGKCKGVKRGYRKTLTFEQYKSCVVNVRQLNLEQSSILSKNHSIYSVSMNRVALTSFDSKRFQTCSKHTLAYGSKFITEYMINKQCPLCINKILE